MSHESCEYCANRLRQAKQIAEKDYTWEGGETTTSVVHTYQQDSATGIWPIDVEIRQQGARVTTQAGDEIYGAAPATSTLWVEVGRRDTQWLIVGAGTRESNVG
ncbi:hypothetical protein DNL40_16120 [Xylanimonas oleitrophica]|uniref:Uncharacterized protein n=2 Tax=Xylanimonas oleitrophica TaxID=2607479 RepID=A0A2W5YBR0_9MICO|nr:hypothetical protein DNL40_16120 [Xylanimonas oleitrophica]